MSDQINQLKMRRFAQYCAMTKFSKIAQIFRKDKLVEIFKQTYIEDFYFTQIYVGKTDSKQLEHINCVHPLNYLLGDEVNSDQQDGNFYINAQNQMYNNQIHIQQQNNQPILNNQQQNFNAEQSSAQQNSSFYLQKNQISQISNHNSQQQHQQYQIQQNQQNQQQQQQQQAFRFQNQVQIRCPNFQQEFILSQKTLNKLKFESLQIDLAVIQENNNQMFIDNMHNASKAIEIYYYYESSQNVLQNNNNYFNKTNNNNKNFNDNQINCSNNNNNNNNNVGIFNDNSDKNFFQGAPMEEAKLDQKIYFMQKIRDPHFQNAQNNNNLSYYGLNQYKVKGKNRLQQLPIDFEMYKFYFQQKQISEQYLQNEESTPYIVFDGILQKIIKMRQESLWHRNNNLNLNTNINKLPHFSNQINLQQELEELQELDDLEMEEEKIQIQKQMSVQRENNMKLFNFFGSNNSFNIQQNTQQNIEIEGNDSNQNENINHNQIQLQQNLLQRNIQHQENGSNPEWDGKLAPQRYIVKDYFGNSCLTILKKKFKQRQREQKNEQKQQKLKKGGGFIYAKKGKNSHYYKKKSGKKSNLTKANFY